MFERIETWWARTFAHLGDLPLRGQSIDSIDDWTLRRIREVTIVILAIVGVGVPFVVQYASMGVWLVAGGVMCAIVGSLINLVILRRTHDPRRAGLVGALMLSVLVMVSNLSSGGFYDPNFAWFYVLPILASLMVGSRAGWVFTLCVMAITLVFWVLPALGIEVPNVIPADDHAVQSLANRLSALAAIGVLLGALHSQHSFVNSKLRDANARLEVESATQRELRDEAVAARQAAEHANEAKNRFLSSLSHELRTPMNTIVGYSEMMIEEDDEPRNVWRDDVGSIHAAALHLSTLIDSLLFLTALESGSLTPTPRRTELTPLIRRLVARHAGRAEERGVAMTVEGDDVEVGVDAMLLEHLVDGLLDNAVKFTAEGRVVCSVKRADEGAVIEVEDTGRGMSADELERVFAQFTKVDDSKTQASRGLGLGLAMCERVAELLGATLECDSEPGVGTTFRLVLPKGGVSYTD